MAKMTIDTAFTVMINVCPKKKVFNLKAKKNKEFTVVDVPYQV
jgi:hypothetical protein